MIYQGSKERLKKYILPLIQSCIDANGCATYVEPFVGGANMIDDIRCITRIGYDINYWIIKLLRYVAENPNISIAPHDCSFEHYKEVRDSFNKKDNRYSDEYKALIGYFASYGGRFYDGGYGRDAKGVRNMYQERLRYARNQAPKLKNISFLCGDYTKALIAPGDFVYCDPPYKGTKSYGNQAFDYNKFYDWVRQVSKNSYVLVSEFYMPEDFECVWSKSRKIMQKSDRLLAEDKIEKLYTLKDGKYYTWMNEAALKGEQNEQI